MSSQPSVNKPTTPDWQHGSETTNQPSVVSSNPIDRSGNETLEETIAMDDEDTPYFYVMFYFSDN